MTAAKAYTEELVRIETEDGLGMEGVVIRPTSGTVKTVPVVWTHGLTGKFYERHCLAIGRDLASKGYVFVSGNNRGHDFGTVYTKPDGTRFLAGGGWEKLDECPLDISAWIRFTLGLGFKGVALLGHSLGAMKVGYYQGTLQDPGVVGLIAASPPLAGVGRTDPALLSLADRMIAEGRGQDLLPWGSARAGGGTWSAEAYAHRARLPGDVYGVVLSDPAVARITCPILAFYGTEEEWVGGAADLELIKRNAKRARSVDTLMIQGGDHSYLGHWPEVADAIATWVARLG
jgi:pimeloyl-ACP methyl ester carboxylesterase